MKKKKNFFEPQQFDKIDSYGKIHSMHKQNNAIKNGEHSPPTDFIMT